MGIEQNEYDDFTCIKNFVFHSDIEDDESGDDKKLTSLVRESYVKRLRQLLKQNYKIWCENDKDESVSGDEKRLSPTEIDRCITFLEDKALQVCMVARIYQKVMVKMMSDIKKSTREMKLFESLIDTKGWIEDRYPDKSTQTETTTKCDNDVQTDPVAFGPRYSLLDLPLPSVNSMASCLEQKTPDSPCKQLKETVAKVMPRVVNRSQDGGGTQKTTDVLTPSRKRRRSSALLDVEVDQNIKLIRRDSVDSFCSDLSSSVAKRDSICGNLSSSMTNLNSVCNTLSSTVTKRDSIRDSLSIKQDSICNNLLSSATNQDSIRDSLSSSVLKQASICDSLSSSLPKRDNKRDSLSSKRDSISSNFSSSEVSLNLMDVSNKPMISNTSLVNSDSLLGADSSLNNELINRSLGIDSSTNIDDNLLSLDARLMEMGLLNIDEQSGDEQSIVAPSPNPGGTRGHRVHKGTWYVEMVAHVCNFHRAYSQLTPDECARIDLRNAQLFGTKRYDRSMKLCDDNLALCRKRIASRVVAELTPFLDKKLIYNRLLFKEFAKRVTESIMDESYAPESSRIKNFVVNFFNRNKSIKSMIDIELCTKEIY